MTPDLTGRLDLVCQQLTEHIMSAALCVKEIVGLVHQILGEEGGSSAAAHGERRPGASPTLRPLLDEATLSVNWRGRALHLGHTQAFWLLSRLARSANRYVTHVDLVQEIWDDEFTDSATLRAGVKRLRVKLRRGGMGDLADAIVGHHGRYMLSLTDPPRHANVTARFR